MKKLLSLALALFLLSVSVFAVQLDTAESEASGVLQDFGSYASILYAISDKGILVFFDNGNAADAYTNSNISLIGLKEEYTVDGYATRGIWDCETLVDNCYTHGFAIVPSTGEAFTYANGDALNGTITLVGEVYNNTTGELTAGKVGAILTIPFTQTVLQAAEYLSLIHGQPSASAILQILHTSVYFVISTTDTAKLIL